jgi:hypothetical protein
MRRTRTRRLQLGQRGGCTSTAASAAAVVQAEAAQTESGRSVSGTGTVALLPLLLAVLRLVALRGHRHRVHQRLDHALHGLERGHGDRSSGILLRRRALLLGLSVRIEFPFELGEPGHDLRLQFVDIDDAQLVCVAGLVADGAARTQLAWRPTPFKNSA